MTTQLVKRHATGSGVKAYVLGLFLFCSAASLSAQQLLVDPLWDSIGLGAGALLAGGSELFMAHLVPPDLGGVDIDKVNSFDRAAMFSYSRGFDMASSILEVTTFALPVALILLLPFDQWLAAAVVYGEVMSGADLTKNLLKYFLPRYRPYVYPGGTVSGGPTDPDWYASFPSGHATTSFAAATFGSVLFATYFPASPYLVPVIVTNLTLAALTGSFRVFAGMHFMTDVIAGAALGAACGYLIPLLHNSSTWNGVAASKSIRLEIPVVSFSL
jgi:membrane-associated phospholipid phosphatase